MRYAVAVTPQARADLLRLNTFLADKSPNAARRAMDAIDAALRSLSDLPSRTPRRRNGLRELSIPFGDSGYVAQYLVMDTSVIIARIFHMREDRGA